MHWFWVVVIMLGVGGLVGLVGLSFEALLRPTLTRLLDRFRRPSDQRKPFGFSPGHTRLYPELLLLDSVEDRRAVLADCHRRYKREKRLTVPIAIYCGVWGVAGAQVMSPEFGGDVLPSNLAVRAAIVLALVLSGVLPLAWFVHKRSRQFIRRALIERGVPVCLQCGYALRGNTSGVCPECGTVCEESAKSDEDDTTSDGMGREDSSMTSAKRWRITAGILALALIVCLMFLGYAQLQIHLGWRDEVRALATLTGVAQAREDFRDGTLRLFRIEGESEQSRFSGERDGPFEIWAAWYLPLPLGLDTWHACSRQRWVEAYNMKMRYMYEHPEQFPRPTSQPSRDDATTEAEP